MNIFAILENLYVNKNSVWLEQVEDTDIDPFIINKFLSMNDELRIQTRFLDKYTFHLPSKMWLSLAWCVLPKYQRMPFVKFIKSVDDEDEYGFILSKIRKHLNLSDNDYKHNKPYLLKLIKDNMVSIFSAYGVEKKYWVKYKLDFSKIKEHNKRVIPQMGLNKWGL